MRVYTYPGYVSLGSAQGGSPKLFRFLEKDCGLKFEGHHWHGTIDSLPKKSAMVRASSMMTCDTYELARRCAELGHFLFYDDRVILPNGEYSGEHLIEEVKKFLEKNRSTEPDVPKEQTIRFLRSSAADRSTHGEAVHAMKQADMLLAFFREHVLLKEVASSTEFAGEYRAIRNAELDHPDNWGGENDGVFGLDVNGMETIRRQVADDTEKAKGLPNDHPVVQAFFRKLARGLERNLHNLNLSFGNTELGYVMMDRQQPNLGVLLNTFRGRHSQWGGVAFINVLMNAMLPPLIERLIALGYPDSEVVEWEYETESM